MNGLLFGTGTAHSILLFAFVIAAGLLLGKFKIKGITIGATWILFIGILISHLGLRVDPATLGFVKDFGLILFVFAIGLQVGPGFFHSFKKGGLQMNLLAVLLVLLAVLTTYIISLVSGESLQTMTGVMSGAVTNTPGLGAAQQTLSDVSLSAGMSPEDAAKSSSGLASAYAVAYPIGVLGVIFVLMGVKALFKVDIKDELAEINKENETPGAAVYINCVVENPAFYGVTLKQADDLLPHKIIVSRLSRNGSVILPTSETVLQKGDILLVVTSQVAHESIAAAFGKTVDMHHEDWEKMDQSVTVKRLSVTKSSLTGKKLKDLNVRATYGVNITRIIRSGMELVAKPNLYLQLGDGLIVVGPKENINKVVELVGNKDKVLDYPNLIPIFFGIVVGILFGSLPFRFPGIPQPVKLGLAGGPLIIAILLGYFGPKWKITTYTTISANMMLREIGIALFLAAVGLGAGENFVSSIVNGGYWWILYGAIITIVPTFLIAVLGKKAFKLKFLQICGLISGGTTDPVVLSFAQSNYEADYVAVNYASVYPLTMFMRVLCAQLLILLAAV